MTASDRSFTFDSFPESYKPGSRRQKAEMILAVLRHELGQTTTTSVSAIDIGCATGLITRYLAGSFKSMTGIDVLPESVRTAEEENSGSNISYSLFDGQSIPYKNEAFQTVILNHVLAYVPAGSHERFLAETFRILKPGGILYLGHANNWYCLLDRKISVLSRNALIPMLSVYGEVEEYTERLITRPEEYRMFSGAVFKLFTTFVRILPSGLRHLAAILMPIHVYTVRKRQSS